MKKIIKLNSKRVLAALLCVLLIALIVAPASTASAVVAEPDGRNEAKRDVVASGLNSHTPALNYYNSDEVKSYFTDSDGNGVISTDEIYSTFVTLANENTTNGSGSSLDAMDNNSLYTQLHDIMSSSFKHEVTYAGTGGNSLAHYWLTTDSSDLDKGKPDSYTFFYSNVSCANNTKMQREHIWPKSQATFHEHNGGSDLHHLRPAYATVNTVKSNWGFGDIKDNPIRTVEWPEGVDSLWKATVDGETFIDVKNDVRGDVARILLYVYVRWHQPNLYSDVDKNLILTRFGLDNDKSNKDDGRKVIQSLDVLLDWMENDPVSEWEMRRNDLTEDIQGNRNVFIDYPELAWLLFDREVPRTVTTPSGEAASQDEVTYGSSYVTLHFGTGKTSAYQGEAKITAVVDSTGLPLQDGSVVERGTKVRYTITPNNSTIESIRYSGTLANNTFSSSNAGDKVYNSCNVDSSGNYVFWKLAGYNWDSSANKPESYTDGAANGNTSEYIVVFLRTKVCELNFNIRSKTAGGASNGGAGSGMVTGRYTDGKGVVHTVESGDAVPINTNVTLTFTPDYGSEYSDVASDNYTNLRLSVEQVSGTDTYQVPINTGDYNTPRKKTISVYFAQTFNKSDSKHIDNSGMWPDENDDLGAQAGFTQNFEICGTQIKKYSDANNKALRFISVIDKNLLSKAQEYGYVLGYTNMPMTNFENQRDYYKFINQNAYTLVRNGADVLTVDCTGTDNTFSGDYGKADTVSNYKYVSVAVKNIQSAGTGLNENTVIIARPYVVLKSEYSPNSEPYTVYGQYIDASTGEASCACSGSYSYISSLSS